MMEAASTSQTSVNFCQTTRATTQETAIFMNMFFPRDSEFNLITFNVCPYKYLYKELVLNLKITELQFLAYGLLIALMMETGSTSETSVNFYQTTRRNIPKTIIFMLVAVRT
jgi:hypothetical protein